MTFEKEFPSLKGNVEEGEELIIVKYITASDVEKNCLDKARVREAIKKLKDKFYLTLIDGSMETNKTDTFDAHGHIEEFEKILGLGDE